MKDENQKMKIGAEPGEYYPQQVKGVERHELSDNRMKAKLTLINGGFPVGTPFLLKTRKIIPAILTRVERLTA